LKILFERRVMKRGHRSKREPGGGSKRKLFTRWKTRMTWFLTGLR
jgi:hypothetical protein